MDTVAPLPRDTSTSDQAATAAERSSTMDKASHPILGQLTDKELARLKSGATAMRSLVRVKVADDAGTSCVDTRAWVHGRVYT